MLFFVLLACLALALMLGTVAHSITYTSKLDTLRTYSGEGIGTPNTVLVNGLDTSVGLSGTTTPACTADACLTLPLVAGAVTLDLTAVADPNLGTVNGTGLTVWFMKLQNPATNANPITITHGALNPYAGFGTTFAITLQPGEEITLYKTTVSAIGAGSKTLDLTGTGTQALNIQLGMG